MMFVSGGSALVFQVGWMRELRLVFGATTAAVAAVLAIFMGGLGLGSAILGRRADQTGNPLRMYGALETAVALTVAASPFLISLVAEFYFYLGGQEALGIAGATVVRLALAMLVLGVPTFLMGGTLPAAARSITAKGDVRRRALAMLYGVNTLGAVCGAYFATFYALEFLGTRATLWLGCAANLFVGVAAVARARKLPTSDRRDEQPAAPVDDPVSSDGERSQGTALAYLTAAVLGFTFFVLELVWYRMLAPILGGTTFTFGLILCMALLGIGVGGAAYHLVFRWLRPSWSILALTCAAEAAFAALPLALGDRLALLAGRWLANCHTFSQIVGGWCVVMAIVVLPVALVSGLQFPLLVALLGQGRVAVSRQLGTAYAWNTSGAIVGSLVGGFGALPLLTAPGTWRAAVLVLAALAATLLLYSWRAAGRLSVAIAGLLAFAVFCVNQTGPTAVWRHSGIGAGRAIVPPADAVIATQNWCNTQRRSLVWEAEGIESSVGIVVPDGLAFVVNGKNDGNAIGDAGTQIGLAILAAALHPSPEKGLVIGLGTGESAGWLASMPGMERVDVVELEPAIDEVARRSSDLNCDALQHPKVRRIYNDGREHMLTTAEKYDVVLSEPSNPYRAGVASLYTEEFYRAVRDRLEPDGVFVQWMQAYEVDEYTVDSVLATARSVFDHVEVWQTVPGDLQVVCSMAPLKYTADSLRRRIAEPVMSAALRAAWHVDDLEGFLAHFLANGQFVDELVRSRDLQLNTDDRNFLEYGFAKTVGLATRFSAAALRAAAIEQGRHRLPLDADVADWDLVEQRRIEFGWLFTDDLAPPANATPQLRTLASGFVFFANGDFRAAIDQWSQLPVDSFRGIDRLVLARAYAELGDPMSLELLEPIAEKFPIEAATIRAIYHWKQQDSSQAAAELVTVFKMLAREPWVISSLVQPALPLAREVADADPVAGERLYSALGQSFAGQRFEPQRTYYRLMIAENLGQQPILEALSAVEPNPPWARALLELRARTYAAVNHPLAAQAQRDWEYFQQYDK